MERERGFKKGPQAREAIQLLKERIRTGKTGGRAIEISGDPNLSISRSRDGATLRVSTSDGKIVFRVTLSYTTICYDTSGLSEAGGGEDVHRVFQALSGFTISADRSRNLRSVQIGGYYQEGENAFHGEIGWKPETGLTQRSIPTSRKSVFRPPKRLR